MFDHIIPTVRVRRKVVKIHHHISVFVVVLGVTATVIALNLNVPTFHPVAVSEAREQAVTVHLVQNSGLESVVAPVTLWPVATVEALVATEHVQVNSFQFLLDGAYSPADIEGISLFIDGIQVGSPVMPDDRGMVRYRLETVRLSKGAHIFSAKMTTRASAEEALFRVSLDPATSFTIDSEQGVRMQLPYKSELMQLVHQGTLGAFVRDEGVAQQAQLTFQPKRLYLYGSAEDFHLESMHIEADRDMTGVRIDFFQGDAFIAAAEFSGTSADVSFKGTSVLVLRDKNTMLSLLTSPATDNQAIITLNSITALGVSSHQTIAAEPKLQLLP
jgi:hypothetical protein